MGAFVLGILIDSQVTIGSAKEPLPGAILDLDSQDGQNGTSKKGLGLPRVKLKSLQVPEDKTSLSETIDQAQGEWDKDAHVGLTVYNINNLTACSGGFAEGLYIWNGNNWDALFAKKLVRPALTGGTEDQSKYPGANTYIVGKGGSISIPVKRAFSIWTDYVNPDTTISTEERMAGKVLQLSDIGGNLTGPLTASVVWEETADGARAAGNIINAISVAGSGENAIINITTNSQNYGNALIALKMNDNVMWQWQIWVPQKDPNATASGYYDGNYTSWFMDMYLGAINNTPVKFNDSIPATKYAHGTHYQWGRPTPMYRFGFPNTYQEVNDEHENLKKAITTSVFIKSETINRMDWYSQYGGQWSDRWGSLPDNFLNPNNFKKISKSPFDPCPQGWRVPGWHKDLFSTTWNCLTKPLNQDVTDFDNQGGWIFNEEGKSIGYHAAAGQRLAMYAGLAGAGSSANVWTGSPATGGSSASIQIDRTPSKPGWNEVLWASGKSRIVGQNIRCVQDNEAYLTK